MARPDRRDSHANVGAGNGARRGGAACRGKRHGFRAERTASVLNNGGRSFPVVRRNRVTQARNHAHPDGIRAHGGGGEHGSVRHSVIVRVRRIHVDEGDVVAPVVRYHRDVRNIVNRHALRLRRRIGAAPSHRRDLHRVKVVGVRIHATTKHIEREIMRVSQTCCRNGDVEFRIRRARDRYSSGIAIEAHRRGASAQEPLAQNAQICGLANGHSVREATGVNAYRVRGIAHRHRRRVRRGDGSKRRLSIRHSSTVLDQLELDVLDGHLLECGLRIYIQSTSGYCSRQLATSTRFVFGS